MRQLSLIVISVLIMIIMFESFNPEAHSESSQTSKMELFAKVDGLKVLSVFRKEVHLKFLTGF